MVNYFDVSVTELILKSISALKHFISPLGYLPRENIRQSYLYCSNFRVHMKNRSKSGRFLCHYKKKHIKDIINGIYFANRS